MRTFREFLRRDGVQQILVAGGLVGIMASVWYVSYTWLIHLSLRLDESQSIWQVTHSFRGMLEVIAQDVHVPFYHVILHYWIMAFGTDVATVRSLSILFFMLAIPMAYLVARQVMSRGWALFATFAFALSPFMLWYANETRMYTLLAFLALANQYFFMRIVQRKSSWNWFGYTITAVLGAYTHYFFMFTLLIQGIYYLLRRKQFPKGTFWKFAGVAAAVIAAMTPWLVYFIAQGAASNTKPSFAHPSSIDFFNIFSQFLFGFQTDAINTVLVSCWPLLVIVAFLTVRRHVKATPPVIYMIMAAIFPVLLAFSLSYVVSPFFLSRYMLPAIAPLYIVIVWLISKYRVRYSAIVAAAWVLIMGLAFYQQYTSPLTPAKESYREVATTVTQKVTPHDIVIMSAPFTVYPFEYYYHGHAQIRTLPLWDRQDVGPVPPFKESDLPAAVNKLIADHQYAYLVLSYDQGYEKAIKDYFDTHFQRVSATPYSVGLNLYVYRVGYKEIPAF